MYTAVDFRKAYDDYVQFNRELKAGTKPMSELLGVLGFGPKPGNSPRHEEFFREMKAAIDEVSAQKPDQVVADGIMDVIFRAKYTYADENMSPYIFSAVEGLTMSLIPFTSAGKARQLYDELKKTPVKLRTPIRKQLMAEFSKRLGGKA